MEQGTALNCKGGRFGSHSHSHHFHLPHLSKMQQSLHLHLHLPHLSLKRGSGSGSGNDDEEMKMKMKDVPKGCLAVYVGEGEEQQRQRFVIPVVYINHPLFEKLLKEAEEEYGFEQKGTITIPCQVSDFQYVHNTIDRERHHSHTQTHAHVGCFR